MTVDRGPGPPDEGKSRQVIPMRPEREQHATAVVGMIFFLASWAMMFGALFYALGELRLGSDFWPPLGMPSLPIGLSGFNTAVIALSSLALEFGRRALKHGHSENAFRGMLSSLLLGLAFLVLQTSLWSDIWASGVHHDSGPYGSLVYFFTGFHAAHVIVGLGLLAWLLPIRKGRQDRIRQSNRATLAAMFWHFVSVVWCFIYLFLFLL